MAITLRVYADEDDVLLFWGALAPIAGCRGFAIARRGTTAAGADDTAFLRNRVGFADDPQPQRHHVVFTRSKATGLLTLFSDGTSVHSGSGGTQALTSAPALRIGCLQSGVNFYRGTVANAAAYQRALLPSEIQAHFHAADLR